MREHRGEGAAHRLRARQVLHDPHYDGHPTVLVRLGAVDTTELAELLDASWRLRAPKRVVAVVDAEA